MEYKTFQNCELLQCTPVKYNTVHQLYFNFKKSLTSWKTNKKKHEQGYSDKQFNQTISEPQNIHSLSLSNSIFGTFLGLNKT